MTLKVVQDTSTNWTAAQWREIEALKKILSEMDNRSGRAWLVGAKVNKLAPIEQGHRDVSGPDSRDQRVLKDLALEVGTTPRYLSAMGNVEASWPVSERVAGVSFSVFRVLTQDPKRFKILATLLSAKDAFDITVDDARRLTGQVIDRPQGLKEWVGTFRTKLARFRGQHLYAADKLALQILRNDIDILLGDAEEEAV